MAMLVITRGYFLLLDGYRSISQQGFIALKLWVSHCGISHCPGNLWLLMVKSYRYNLTLLVINNKQPTSNHACVYMYIIILKQMEHGSFNHNYSHVSDVCVFFEYSIGIVYSRMTIYILYIQIDTSKSINININIHTNIYISHMYHWAATCQVPAYSEDKKEWVYNHGK